MSHFIKSTYEYSKVRRNFGRQPLFQSVPAHIVDSIYSDKNLQREYGLRNPVHRESQATLPQSEHDCNTKQVTMRDQGMDHQEGGWPREVHREHEELVHRHCRRVTHDESYIKAVINLAPSIEHCLNQNNAIEMYNSYFTNMEPQLPVEKYSIKIANTYRDSMKRAISDIVWTNEKHPKLVTSYYNPSHSVVPDDTCHIWDIQIENEPVHLFQSEHPVWRIACCPENPNIILCGLESGLVNIFDVQSGRKAVSSSSVYNSHLRSITGIHYIVSRTHMEFFTGSPDGLCLWWDIRNLSMPINKMPMSIKLSPKEIPSIGNAEGVSALQFNKGMPTKFLCGTESGYVINVNRLGKTHSEIMSACYKTHCGPVRAVHRSPCTMRMFITCGDWDVRIWSEEVRTAPIVVHPPYRYQVTDVAWAPLRFSSYMSICEGGTIYYWDLLRKYKDPVATLHVSDYALTKIKPHEEGELVAVGDKQGCTQLLILSANMSFPGSRDKILMSELYERETKREHILDNRLKEINLKRHADEAAALTEHEKLDVISEEDQDQETEIRYFDIVNKDLENMVEKDQEQQEYDRKISFYG